MHGLVAVLDGYHGHAVQAPAALGTELRRPPVVHAGHARPEHGVLQGRHAQSEAREQHHLVDAVGVGVGEHPVHGPGIDPGGGGEPVLRRAPRARSFVLGIGAPFDQDPEPGVGAQRDVVGEALHQLGEELQGLHRVGIGVHHVQVRRHHCFLPFSFLPFSP